MKLAAAQADGFCNRPDPAIGLVLLFGPDQGLASDRRRRLITAVLDQPDDPFRMAELSADRLLQAPGLLIEEAQAMSLVGGRRVVLVRQAVDGIAKALQALLAMCGHEALVILEAGDLGTSSPLRRLVEKTKTAAAIPCYRADGRQLEAQLRGFLQQHRLSIEPEAMSFLAAHVGSNRELTQHEVDKLALYKGDADGDRVTLADVEASVGNSSVLGIDRLVWVGLIGRPGDAARALDRLLGEGQAPIRLIRALATTLMRLMPLRARVDAGESSVSVVDGLRPPVHFSQKGPMVRALESWPSKKLEAGLGLTMEAELAAKRARSPDRLLVRHLLFELQQLSAEAVNG